MFALAACGEKELMTEAPTQAAPPSPTYSATAPPGVELPPSQTTPGPIPLEFRHVWAIEKAYCTKAPSLTRIAIAPGAVKFYEGRSAVTSANVPHEGELVMEVEHAAEGQTEHEVHTLKLEADGTQLSYERRGQTFTYIRCD